VIRKFLKENKQEFIFIFEIYLSRIRRVGLKLLVE
jgi:hypothetical protein